MKAWFKRIPDLALLTALSCILQWENVFADALDDWHTNGTFSASDMVYGNGRFVAFYGTTLKVSLDGTNWTQYISPPVLNYQGIAFGGGMFMTFGTSVTNSNGPHYILQSYDGVHWTNVYQTSAGIGGAAYGNNQFVFTGSHVITATLNPLQWNEFDAGVSFAKITFGAGQFVAITGGSSILSSTDGVVWQYDYTANNVFINHIVYGNGIFVASCNTYDSGTADYAYGFLVSSNVVSWQPFMLDTNFNGSGAGFGELAFGGGNFIDAISTNYNLTFNTYTSTNGFNWVNRAGANNATFFNFGGGSFLGYGNGILLQSGVFAPSTNPPPSSLTIASYPGVTINGMVGATYQIQCATNLNSTWLTVTNISLPYSPFIWIDASAPIAGQKFYRSIQLQ